MMSEVEGARVGDLWLCGAWVIWRVGAVLWRWL